jgi:hypothetical protein
MQDTDFYNAAQEDFDPQYLQNIVSGPPPAPAAQAAQPATNTATAKFVEPDYGQMMFGEGQDAALGNTTLGIGRNAAVNKLLGGGWENSTDFEQYLPEGNLGESTGARGVSLDRSAPDYVPFDVSKATGKAQQRISPTQYVEQSYGPGGKLLGDFVIKDYPKPDTFDKIANFGINAVMVALLTPVVGPVAASAIASGAKTIGQGGSWQDALKNAALAGATSYATSAVGDILPKNLANTGITSLDTALNKGIQSAAGSGVTSLLTGNKNALQDALMAGAGAAVGSGANSAMESTFGNTGLPAPATNILSSAALAAIMGKDPGEYALKSALGEITGAIKGSAAEGKQTSPGVAAPKDLMSNITEPGEYPQPDGSLLTVSRPEKGVNAGKLIGNLYSKEDLTRQANEEAYASWPQQITSNVDAEQAQLLSFANQAANPNLRQNVLRDMRQEDKDYIEKSLAEGGTPQQIINAYIAQQKSPEDAARMVNAIAGPTSLSTEETAFTAKEPEPSSGNSDQMLEDAGLVQKDAAMPDQSSVLIQSEKSPSDFGLDFGAFAERPEATANLNAAPQKVEITGQTPDTELMRFLEANGLTADEAQKVLITGKDQTAGTDYNSFYETPGSLLTPKVVVQGQTPPKDTAVDDLMAMLNQYDPQLDDAQRVDINGKIPPIDELGTLLSPNDTTQRVDITGTTPKTVPIDFDLNLDRYYPGDTKTEVPSTPDKLTDDLLQQVEITDKIPPIDELMALLSPNDTTQRVDITGTTPLDYSSLEYPLGPEDETPKVVIRDKLVDEPPFDGHVMPPVEQPVQVPVAPDKPIVDPIRPPIKPIVDPIRPIVKPIVTPKVTTTSGGSITIPGMTQQLHQELMQLPDFDLERLLSPSLYAYHQAEKRKQSSQEDRMNALLSQLGYRS